MSAGLTAIRLVRRVGLAVGAFILVNDLPAPYNRLGMAFGVAIVAFFLPRVESSSFAESDKESA